MSSPSDLPAHSDPSLEGPAGELEEVSERWHNVFKFAPIGMALVDLDGRWMAVNDALCAIVGYPREELLELDFQQLTHEEDLETDLGFVKEMLAGERETYKMEKRYIHKNGGTVPVMLSVSLVHHSDGSPRYFVSQVEDITERKEIERDLERTNEELAQFAYLTSHDLRSPLRSMAGAVGLLERSITAAERSDTTEKHLGMARDGIRRMEALIDDILALAQATSKTWNREPVELSELVERVVDSYVPMIEGAGGRVEIGDGLPRITADPRRLEQVFSNLVQNSIKYRSSDRDLVVRIHGERIGPEYQVVVEDNGIGIAPRHAERIFQIFQRLHGPEEYEGTGLGLTMVDSVVRRLGGRAWLDTEVSDEGKGATFRVSFPIPRS